MSESALEVALAKSTDWKGTAALVGIGAVLLFFWHSAWLWPLKILVVLFHELGHAVAAWMTGGEVLEIGLSPDQGGHTLTRGGLRLVILNAGYLGSLLSGVGLLVLSREPRRARAAAWVLAVALAVVTVAFVRPLASFGFAFALLAAAAVALLASQGGPTLVRLALRGLGAFSVLYALFDVRDDVFRAGDGAVTDATMLAELTGVPAMVWGLGWMLAGAALLVAMRRKLT